MKDAEKPNGPNRESSLTADSTSHPRPLSGAIFDATVDPVAPVTVIEAELIADPGSDTTPSPVDATVDDQPSSDHPPRRRRIRLPVLLFLATLLSTFWVGVVGWGATGYFTEPGADWRRAIIRNWDQGLVYMGCLVAILLCHEMGHFLTCIRYRIRASLPFFIPMPMAPLGTLGAVIGMDGRRANRRQLFDIGIGGPLAGLVIAVPVLCVGVAMFDFKAAPGGTFEFDLPILARWLFALFHPAAYQPGMTLTSDQLNPCLMAGWVGMLVTGLNMMPISQLDGGHVLYTLFGRAAHLLARLLVFLLIFYIVFWDATIWAVMLTLVILLGIDHPPTSNDRVELGWFRRAIGLASLSIPLLCIPPQGIWVRGM